MLARRAVMSLCAFASLTASCRLLRPIDPGAPDRTAEKTEAAAPAPVVVLSSKETGPVNDGTIAAMVLASNNTDISYARMVPSRAQRDDVKQFAERVLTDHIGINALVTDLLEKLDIAPQDNVASLDMRDESAEKRDAMRELVGFAFDSTYITNEVLYHQKFLASLDQVMIPRARNDRLQALLNTIRPAVAAHLAHAEQVWANVMAKR
jgi:putative membrane protein